jgi:hypothetical protein
MIDAGNLNLSSYDDVRALADRILKRVKGVEPVMPRPPDYPWTPVQIALLQRWKDEGFPQ